MRSLIITNMTNLDLNQKLNEAKSKLGEQTTKLENKASEL